MGPPSERLGEAAWGPLLLLPALLTILAGPAGASSESAVTNFAFWNDYPLDRPLEERVYAAPPELIAYLVADNIKGGYDERPCAAAPDDAFLADMRGAIAELPTAVKRLVGRRLVGVFPVDDLGSTAYAELIRDAGGKAVAAFLALDVGVIDTPANTWATWRANTPFLPRNRWGVRVTIETEADDTRRNAMQYIMMHEFGHVAAVGTDIHPPWDRPFTDGPEALCARYAFPCLSWTVDGEGHYRSLFEESFPLRAEVRFYKGPAERLPIEDAPAIYADLDETNFVSLYGATTPYEDFAETLVSYVHTQMLKRPYRVDVVADGEVAQVLSSCWDTGRCDSKRAYLEELLGRFEDPEGGR
ncbi:MAG: hypothetical protein CMM50_05125 [Rhodospirillaceae bacterium]|nr:hypothetical protein [Rhodospirillaceae bacterium]